MRLIERECYLVGVGFRYISYHSRLAVSVKKTSEKPACVKKGCMDAIRNIFFSESVHAKVMDRGMMDDVHGWEK